MQVDVHLLQKELTSDEDAVSTNLTSFHQYDEKVCYLPQTPNLLAASTQKAHQCVILTTRNMTEMLLEASYLGIWGGLVDMARYAVQISCLAWDHSGRFLATGDCGEATVW